MDDLSTLVDALSPIHMAYVDKFQREQKLATPADALRLLLDIAIEAVNDTGDRFWDAKGPNPRRR